MHIFSYKMHGFCIQSEILPPVRIVKLLNHLLLKIHGKSHRRSKCYPTSRQWPQTLMPSPLPAAASPVLLSLSLAINYGEASMAAVHVFTQSNQRWRQKSTSWKNFQFSADRGFWFHHRWGWSWRLNWASCSFLPAQVSASAGAACTYSTQLRIESHCPRCCCYWGKSDQYALH